jgi:hypothetical protein
VVALEDDDLSARVAATEALLLRRAIEKPMTVSGDLRINEGSAAELLGMHPGYLKHLRHEGKGPRPYPFGVGGGRWSYRLAALARWIEEGGKSDTDDI